jgi:hypothetical protein
MYAGPKIATNEHLYVSNSFIINQEIPDKPISKVYFGSGVSLSVICHVR